MKLQNKVKFILIALLIILNVILRYQVVPHEIGADSFDMHTMTNSINEYGYAKWIIHPLSFFGLFPASYASSMQFLLSGISQSTGIEMNTLIFLYDIFIGLLSMFTIYLMAGEIINDDLFKFLVAFGFSTSPSLLGYTTWTIPTRGLLMVLAPLLIYSLLKIHTSRKYVLLTILLAFFLLATHHLFYFLIPSFFVFFILIMFFRFIKYSRLIKIPDKIIPIAIISGFFLMFSIPFITGRFVENSRYSPIYFGYIRYTGILFIPAIGGICYLISNNTKKFGEWFILLNLMLIVIFIYEQTYMKWFLPLFLIPFAGIGLLNIIKVSGRKKQTIYAISIFLILSLSYGAFYQFLHFMDESESSTNDRYIEESSFRAGNWMKYYANSSAISNDVLFGSRILAVSETTHLLGTSTVINNIYGYININSSQYKRYSITQEEFWSAKGYEGTDKGEEVWYNVHMGWKSPANLNISLFVENTKNRNILIWNHGGNKESIPLTEVHKKGRLLYDGGKPRIWGFF